ncbi:MAG: hypothetical protein IVW55_12785 [Chloroflexi bacterium]|nr:hypothetical protein [Chloroflexota bacterium]
MGLTPLHKLEEMIRAGDAVEDGELIALLGKESLIAVPLQGGGERHLPSGEILSVLAGSAGLSIAQLLSRSFRMSAEEIDAACTFINLVQFAGADPPEAAQSGPEQPLQPLDS